MNPIEMEAIHANIRRALEIRLIYMQQSSHSSLMKPELFLRYGDNGYHTLTEVVKYVKRTVNT
jgi:hypothetical protein